jgi:hypothetical protein
MKPSQRRTREISLGTEERRASGPFGSLQQPMLSADAPLAHPGSAKALWHSRTWHSF